MKVHSDLQLIVKTIKDNGYKAVPNGKNHYTVLDAKGRRVVDENGPVIISSTPGDFRARDMHVKRLMGAGVLKEDPWAPTKKKAPKEEGEKKKRGLSDEQRAAILEANKREAKRRADRTKILRERLEPIVAKIGGWNRRGFTAEFGRVFFAYAQSHSRVEAPQSLPGAMQSTRSLAKGGTMSDHNATCFEMLVDDLAKAQADGKLNERYMELVRLSKGLDVHGASATPAPGMEAVNGSHDGAPGASEPDPRATAPPPPRRRGTGIDASTTTPGMLAVEVTAFMARGLSPEDSLNEVLQLAQRVLTLELGQEDV